MYKRQYLYSANRVKYPMVRGQLLKSWRDARASKSPVEGQPAPAADVAGPSVPPQNELENRAITEWLLGKNHRSYRRIRPDDILRVSMASVDDEVSASRWPGKKPRDGP